MTDNLKTVAPIEEFDWDAYAKGDRGIRLGCLRKR